MFIRSLWGDSAIERFAKAKDDIFKSLSRLQLPYQRVYCYGRSNREFLNQLGIESTLLSGDGVVNFSGVHNRDWKGNRRGWAPWRVAMWRHKIEVIVAGACQYGEIVWIDWDVKMRKPLPSDFWDRMREGPPLQGATQRLKRPTCYSRVATLGQQKIGKHGNAGQITHGAWIYVRGAEVAQRIRELAIAEPTIVDQAIFAKAIDELAGGWRGAEWLRQHGFEPYCYECRNQAAGPPEETLFLSGR